MTFDTIDGICPNCGPGAFDLLASGLWDGWSESEALPDHGVCYTGRCRRCGSILETLLAGDEAADAVEWSPVPADRLETIEWVISGRPGWPAH